MTELERNVLAFTAGLALALMAYSIWDNIVESAHIKEAEDRPKPRPAKPEDAISIEALAELAMTGNIQLQESATSILLDRAMSEEHLSYIMRACTVRNHPRLLKIAIHTVHQLAQIEDNRPVLIRMRALKILVRALNASDDDDTRRYATSAIYSLVSSDERRKTRMVHYGVVKPLMAILSEDRKPNSDLKYFALTLLHQISLRDDLHPALIEANAIEVLVKLTRESFTNSSMQKLCLHSLVRIVSAVPVEESHMYITRLAELRVIPLIGICLRYEDYELVSWAILLLHEFAVKDIAKDQIASISGLFKAIAYCLSNNETVIARVTLRIVKSLCTENIAFQRSLVRSKLLPPLIAAIRSRDPEAQHWAMAVMHDLTGRAEMQKSFLDSHGLETLLTVSATAPRHIQLYIADTLVQLCSNAENADRLASSDVVNLIINLCNSPDHDVQYAGVALILNASTLSRETMLDETEPRACAKLTDTPLNTESSYEKNGIEIVDAFLRDNQELSLQIVATKALVTIAEKDPSLRFQITVYTIRPMLLRLPQKVGECVECIFPGNGPAGSRRSPRSPSFSSPISAISPLSTSSPIDATTPVERRAGTVSRSRKGSRSRSPARSQSSKGSPLEIGSRSPWLPVAQTSPRTILTKCTNVRNLLSCLFILVDTESFDHVDQSKGESALLEYISDVLDETCSALLDLLALPLVDRSYMDLTSPVSARTPLAYPPLPSVPSATDENAPAKNKAFSADVESAEAHGNEPPMANPPRTASSEPSHEELGQQIASGQLLPGGPVTEHSEIEDIKADIATNSLRCVSRLFRYAPVKELMIREKLVALLIGLCGLPRKELSQQAFATLALCIKQGLPIQELLSIPMAFITILKFVVTENAQALYFHLNLMLEHACRFGPMPYEPSGAMLRNAVYTPGLVIAHSTQELRSDGWKFCSLRVALGVTGGGRYSYDFVIRTSNIMQIGWASEKCHFNSEAGTGVGDDEHSYAYDGHRMKRWHAELDNNSYGRSWSPGDTVTSVIDLDQCTITYYLNGESMGVAFESIDPWQTWYPAVSLSSDQMGLFRFGGKLDPLRFPVKDATPFAHVRYEGSTPLTHAGRSISPPGQPALYFNQEGRSRPLSRGAPGRRSSMSPKHREKDVHSADTEIETAPALSLYFEVQIDLDDLPAAECAQVGVLLQDTHMIAACMHRRSRTLVWLKIQGVHYSNDNVLSTQITEYLDANLEDIDPDASEPVADADGEAPLPDGVEIVHKMAGADWQTGDWVGCGVYLHQRTVFFTWNGVLQGPEISPASGGNEAACLPYVRGVPHFTINLSETPFKWAAANADRFCVLAWPP
ncbi:hypothetical protein HK105_203955 [Polyrhizophydium stewartii]|uniref:B30.2/SPRY domain-containing protein n=1 Tax=Polyrhizophydium stewartii TaxID=2732419 RepID=A0ABR4NAF9_9FUNG